jgi:hypothetical protein
MTLYLPPDMELFLTGWLRSRIPEVRFANREPDNLSTPLEQSVVVIRDDSGVSVLAGSKTNDKPANDLARLIYAHLTCDEIITAQESPVSAIIGSGCNGPYPVQDDHDYARRYMTVEYSTVGTIQ